MKKSSKGGLKDMQCSFFASRKRDLKKKNFPPIILDALLFKQFCGL
jgi:hypothetical protein